MKIQSLHKPRHHVVCVLWRELLQNRMPSSVTVKYRHWFHGEICDTFTVTGIDTRRWNAPKMKGALGSTAAYEQLRK